MTKRRLFSQFAAPALLLSVLATMPSMALSAGYRCPISYGHTISSLPRGYQSLFFNNSRYYHHGGHFYRPFGRSFSVVAPPVGLRVSSLHRHSNFNVGGIGYSYSHSNYYRRGTDGYVVVGSPFSHGYNRRAQGPTIYRSAGQSREQLETDRKQCGEHAVAETGYNQQTDRHDSGAAYDYRPTFRACLERRGYTMK